MHRIITLVLAIAAGAGPACALELTTLWRVPTPGQVRSSPTLWAHGEQRGVVVTSEGGAVALYGPDGQVRWTYRAPRGIYRGAAVVGDLDRDGAPEIVAATADGAVVCLDGAGEVRWRHALRGPFGWCSPLLADLEGDERLEVALPDEMGHVSVLDCEGRLRWRYQAQAGMGSPPAAADLDGDGHTDLLAPSGDGALAALGRAGLLWLYDERAVDLYCAPTVADLDGDGSAEVLQGYGDGALVCLQGATGRVKWTAQTGSGIDSAVSVADLDGDGRLEILVGHHEDGLLCLDARGEVRFRSQRDLGGRTGFPGVISAAAVADVNGDGQPEVIFGYRHGPLVVVDGSGRVLAEVALREGMNGSPLVADLDGDGALEIVAVSLSEVVCVSAGGAGRVQWAAFRNTPHLTGAADLPKPATPPARVTERRQTPGGGPPLAFGGTEGDQSLLVVGPVRSGGLVWAQVRRPDGVAYATARRLKAGESLTLPFEPYAAGEYIAQARLVAGARAAGSEIAATMTPFAGHMRFVREAARGAWETVENLDLSPGSAGAGLLARQALMEGMAARVESAAQSGGPDAARDLAPQAESLVRRAEHLRRAAEIAAADAAGFPCLVWQADPWLAFDESALPAHDAAGFRAEVPPLYRDERHPVALNLLNLSERTLAVRLEPGDLAGGRNLPWQQHVEVLTLRAVGSRAGIEVWDALPRLGPDRIIEIPTMEARQMWVMLDTAGLEPGRYTLPLRLLTTEQRHREKDLALVFEVMGMSLREARQARFCNWAYFYQPDNYFSRCQEEALADLVKHGTNVFVLVGRALPRGEFDAEGNLVGAIDWNDHDEIVERLHPHGVLLYCGYQGGVRGPAAYSAAWERAHDTLVRELVKRLEEMGLGYEDFALYPVDEPGITQESVEAYLRLAKAAKRADPRVRVYVDPVGGMSPEKMREAAPYTDIWCPGLGWVEQRPQDMALMLSTGEVWSYACADNVKTRPLLDYYVVPTWYAWRHGVVGVGFWTYCTTPYNPWVGDDERDGEYALAYPGDVPVSSRRWEAAAMGLQDYAALELLRDAIAAAADRAPAAQAALDEAVALVLAAEDEPGRSQALAAARREVAAWTLRLRGE